MRGSRLVLRVSASTESDAESNLASGRLHYGFEASVADM